uniref:Uncharacterized protein n=1 Tax=Trepomonas sp. PC1 TaxID=1076344 RepID=A0A146K5E5_9EUKA|eukprot:JAP90781.1 hypothetical protein TPC1_17820 [Trepomonas sp. PC1]
MLPPSVAKILNLASQQSHSAQGFIIAEKNIKNSPALKLLCAFARRWGSDVASKGDDYNCEFLVGKNRVADVVRQVLTYLPSSNFNDLLTDLQSWLADRVAEANLQNEPWFTKDFCQLVDSRRGKFDKREHTTLNENPDVVTVKKELKQSQMIDMTEIQQRHLARIKIAEQQAIDEKPQPVKSAPSFPMIVPKPKQNYQYRDRSHSFYKTTYNEQSEPQAILTDAQHQLIHGEKIYILDAQPNSKNPSTFENNIRKSVHIVNGELNVPLHEKQLQQPIQRTKITNQLQLAQELDQRGVTDKLDAPSVELQMQQIFAHQIDKSVLQNVKAYSDGRAKAKALHQQMKQSVNLQGGGTRHMNDLPQSNLQYFSTVNRQVPLIHDIDDDFECKDSPMQIHDDFVDQGDDFTGLGIGQMGEVMKQTFTATPQEGILEKEQRPGYQYRQKIVSETIDKMAIPQFDRQTLPLDLKKNTKTDSLVSADQLVKQRVENAQIDVFNGGKRKIDPKVYQGVMLANNLFTNDDLGLQSDSEEQKLLDSEASDEIAIKEVKIDFQRRSEQLQGLKSDLDKFSQIKQEVLQSDQLLKQMNTNKAKVIKKEKEQFDKDQAEKMRELKKKMENADESKKKKMPKPKTFKPKCLEEMAKTISGAPRQIEQMVIQQREQNQTLLGQKQLATAISKELDSIAKKDREMEETFEQNINKQLRQTEMFPLITQAQTVTAKETVPLVGVVKQLVGKHLIPPSKEQLARQATQYQPQQQSSEPTEFQMPFIYQKPLIQEIKEKQERTVKLPTQIDAQQSALISRTYLPVPPPQKEANSTRGDWISIGRQNQTVLIKKSDQEKPISDLQQMINKAELFQKQTVIKKSKLEIDQQIDHKITNLQKPKEVDIQQENAKPHECQQMDLLRAQIHSAQQGRQNVSLSLMEMYQKNKKDAELKQKLKEAGINVLEAPQVEVVPNPILVALSNVKPLVDKDPFAREAKKKKEKKGKKGKKGKK